ncbi:MAG: M48 family metalloprotease [Candidatus Eiseniibacteriota bacterium]
MLPLIRWIPRIRTRPLSARPRTRAYGPLALAAVALATVGLAVGCATNPITGKKEISFVSESQELEAGKQSKAATEQTYGYYDDPKWTAEVTGLGKRMAAVSHRPDLQWEFFVLDDPTVNAFAAPGGYIYITRGILAQFNSEAQLAGVMGHEIGHVTSRHYADQATRQQIAGVGLGVASMVSKTVARYGQAASEGLGLLFLSYGRGQESESDRLGVDYSIKAGYDPREMPGTYEALARISARAGARIPSYLSTHPDPEARAVTVRELATQQVGSRTDLKVNREGYIRSLDGMVYGPDPRQGYFEQDRYYHPVLKFSLDFPAGWQHQNGKTAVIAGTEDQKAAMRLNLANAGTNTPEQYVNALISQKQISGAEGKAEKINGLDAWLGRLQVTDNQGQKGVLQAAFIRHTPERMYQLLGQMEQGSTYEQGFVSTARSFKTLTDAARINVTPAKIKIVDSPRTGLFNEIVPTLGAQAIDIEQSAILNGVEVDDQIVKGRPIKLVSPGKYK